MPQRAMSSPLSELPLAQPNDEELQRIVAEVVRQTLQQGDVLPAATRRRSREDDPPRKGQSAWRARQNQQNPTDNATLPTQPPVPHSELPGLRRVANPDGLQTIADATPARLVSGRAGLRYPTHTYLTLRADHAVAKDAVVSEPTKEFLQKLAAIELRTQAADLQTFLLLPDHGRVLDDASLLKLKNKGSRNVDIQLIFADGLSAWAADRNAALLPELQQALSQAGFSHGKPIWVHRARIAVADQIGVELGAKATVICLGERPGLGTGDSLSIYIAWNPAISQDNSEKNCISNVRPAGFSVQAAAAQCADILRRAREINAGGLAIGKTPTRTW